MKVPIDEIIGLKGLPTLCIPLQETTDIILDNLDEEHVSGFGLDKSNLSKLLNLATCNYVFLFNDKLYNQIDGVGMGIQVHLDLSMQIALWVTMRVYGCLTVLLILNHFYIVDM